VAALHGSGGLQIEIAGKTVKVFVFPETTAAGGSDVGGMSGAPGKPPVSFPRYSFQVRFRLLLFTLSPRIGSALPPTNCFCLE
jgi:hypothetical protein